MVPLGQIAGDSAISKTRGGHQTLKELYEAMWRSVSMTLTMSVVASHCAIRLAFTPSADQPVSKFVTSRHLLLIAFALRSAAFKVPIGWPESMTGGSLRRAASSELMWVAERLRWLELVVLSLLFPLFDIGCVACELGADNDDGLGDDSFDTSVDV